MRVRHGEYRRRLAAAASLSLSVLIAVRPSKKEAKHTCNSLLRFRGENRRRKLYIRIFFFFNTLLERLQHLGPCTQVEEEVEEERG